VFADGKADFGVNYLYVIYVHVTIWWVFLVYSLLVFLQ